MRRRRPPSRTASAARSRRSPTTGSCRTARRRALIAPSGNVEWMCLPRMDSPSVFGAILDRDAGLFRIGPADVRVPAARRYLPGTMVLETSWDTPRRLGDRPRRAAGRPVAPRQASARARTAARRPTTTPTTCCCARCAASTARCRSRSTASRPSTTGASAGRGTTAATATTRPCIEHDDLRLRLVTDLNLGLEGPRATARHMMKEGETLFCALAWSEHDPPRTYDDAYDRLHLDRAPLAALARPRRSSPTIPGAPTCSARRSRSRASPTRPRARSSPRRRRRCPRRRRASATGTTATRGSATRPSRCGACTRSASTGRPTTSSTSSPTAPSRPRASCRSCTASTAAPT